MPAAAVIPAPIAYIKVVAVKKLVVESVSRAVGSPPAVLNWHARETSCRWDGAARVVRGSRSPVPATNPTAVLFIECRGGPARLL